MPMKINVQRSIGPGDKVIFTNESLESEFASEAEQIREHLQIKKVYIVERTHQNPLTTDVWLKDVLGGPFILEYFQKVE